MEWQVQRLPPVFDESDLMSSEAPGYEASCRLAMEAFQRAVDGQPDEWVLHLYLGKAYVPRFCHAPLQFAVWRLWQCI